MFATYHLFVDVCRNLGWRQGFRTAIVWLLRREFLVLLRDLETIGTLAAPDPSIDWIRLVDESAATLPGLNPALTTGEVSRRLRDGQICELAYFEGSAAHYRWTATRQVYLPYLGRHWRVEPGDILVTDLFTHPRFRRHGIHRQSVCRAIRAAKESGYRRYLSLVARWNVPVLRTAGKTGASIAGSVGYWNLALGRRYFARGAVRFEGDVVVLAPSVCSVSHAPVPQANTASTGSNGSNSL